VFAAANVSGSVFVWRLNKLSDGTKFEPLQKLQAPRRHSTPSPPPARPHARPAGRRTRRTSSSA